MFIEPKEDVNQLARLVLDAAMEVHRTIGPGYMESIYEEALSLELDLRGILFKRQHPISISYKGKMIGEGRLDLLINDKLIIELKAVEQILPVHKAQLISYLKMTGCSLGILINFNAAMLKDGIKRVVLSDRIKEDKK